MTPRNLSAQRAELRPPGQVGDVQPVGPALLVGASAVRSSASYCLLSLLRWTNDEVPTTPRAVVLASGPLQEDFRRAGARVLGEPFSAVHQVERVVGRLASLRVAGRIRRERQRAALLRPHRPPVVYAATVHAAGPVVRFVAGRAPVVIHAYEGGEVLDDLVGAQMMARLVSGTSLWVASSAHVEGALLDRGVPAAQVVRCEPFIDEPDADPAAVARARRSLGLADGELLVGGVGRSTWEDAPEVFLRVASVVRRRAPGLGVRFAWVGAPDDGPSRWILDHDVRRAGLGDVVTFVDGTEDTASWLSAFDLLCVTSRLDAPPPTAIEGGALGTPAVVFDRGGLAELADDVDDPTAVRRVGYLDVESMAQAVIEAAEQPDARIAGGGHFRRVVRARHLATTKAPELWRVLTDVAAGEGHPAPPGAVGGERSPRR